MSADEKLAETKSCLVTVLMTAYNAENTVEQAVRSIMQQTYRDWRLLILDDGSTDGTAAICDRLAQEDDRIVFRRCGRLGFCAVLDMGLRLIQSRYLARLDADDIAYPSRLEKQMAFLSSNPDVKVLATLAHRITATGKVITRLGEGPASVAEYHQWVKQRKPYFILNSTLVADREILLRYGGYRWDDYPADDTALYTRIAREHIVLTLPEELVGYRISPGGITSQNTWKMVLQFKRLDYNLEHGTDLDFETFSRLIDRQPLKKLWVRWGALHKATIRKGAYYLWHRRPIAGLAYLLVGSLLLPHQALRRLVRWA